MPHFTRHKLIEGGIAAGTAFFGALVGIAFAGAFPEAIWAAAIAGALAFFISIGANGIAGSP